MPCSLRIAILGLVFLILKFEGISNDRNGLIPFLSVATSCKYSNLAVSGLSLKDCIS